MPQPNMKKEYRAELKSLRKHRRHAQRELKAFIKAMRAAINKIHKEQIDPIFRDINSATRQTERSLRRYAKRIAILEGRLS